MARRENKHHRHGCFPHKSRKLQRSRIHGLHQLTLDRPSGDKAYSKLAPCLHHRDSVLGVGKTSFDQWPVANAILASDLTFWDTRPASAWFISATKEDHGRSRLAMRSLNADPGKEW